jgi:D-threo-aldose 1-dehydrogenase
VKALEEKIPAEFWSDLKQENLIEQKAEVPA